MGSGIFARALGNQRLRRMKGRKVSIPAGVFPYFGGENGSCAAQALPSLVQMLLRFGRRRPTRRLWREGVVD